MSKTNFEKWKNSGQYFKYRNYNIFYRDEGQGDVLVCIHGFPTASWDWHLIWTDLIKKFRVITLDMIGFGYSDKPKNYLYSIIDQASLIEEWLHFLNIPSVHILAHDYGDTVTQELLARYEKRKEEGDRAIEIKSICFLNGGLFPETHRALLLQKLLMSPLGPIISKLSSESVVRKRFSSIFGPNTQPSDNEWTEFWSLMTFNEGRKILHKLIRYMAERVEHRERWVIALQQTTLPIRLINGPVDPISGIHMVNRYEELVPHPDIVLLENIGHYPQVEAPSEVLTAFLNFIANNDRLKDNSVVY